MNINDSSAPKPQRLTLYRHSEMLVRHLDISRKLGLENDEGLQYVCSLNKMFGVLRPYSHQDVFAPATETTTTLAEWIQQQGCAVPKDKTLDDEESKAARRTIIGIALQIAEEVKKLHGVGETMCGSLSPRVISIRTEKPDGRSDASAPRTTVSITDYSAADVDTKFTPPWTRSGYSLEWDQRVSGFERDSLAPDPGRFVLASRQADVFALGAVFWALCVGSTDFAEKKDWRHLKPFMDDAAERTVPGWWRWRFFFLCCACLHYDFEDEFRDDLPTCCIRIISIENVVELLHAMHGADDLYPDAREFYTAAHYIETLQTLMR